MNGLSVEEIYDVAQYLYQLLDDIEDVCKIQNHSVRMSIVENIKKKKNEVVAECDGYTVVFKPLKD